MGLLRNIRNYVSPSKSKGPRLVNGIEIPIELDFVGGQLFEETGNEFLEFFTKYGELKPEHSVLDVGCGIGRMAIPLTGYLSQEGSYKGFDIVPDGIEWCQQNITSKYPNFEFAVADIYNNLYNPQGTQKSVEYSFPYKDQSFDFVFLTSVFTHMFAEDSQQKIDDGKSLQNFQHSIGECHIVNREMPEASTGYNETFIRSLYSKYNLEIVEPIRFGGWSGRVNFTSYQDIVCAQKR